MNVRAVDPRDIETAVRSPVYRVYFWNAEKTHSWEFEITGADGAGQVIEWANADGRPYELLVVEGHHAVVLRAFNW
jgi:hypothetical protein